MKFAGRADEYFEIIELNQDNKTLIEKPMEGQLSVIWFTEDNNQLHIDLADHNFSRNHLVCLTEFNNIKATRVEGAKFIRFNVPFYCLLNHDSEVGCKGVLFFGSWNVPVLFPSEEEVIMLENLTSVFYQEMKSKDELQLEMLQMLLKRFLILCTRIYKSQSNYNVLEKDQQDIVREFNFLVEQHYKTKHSVAEYADLLNKSPKTISNLFGKVHDKTPLQMIQNRIMLEVRRLLKYSSKPISEIGYEVGFNDPQTFSRFFKKNEGVSPSEFRLN